MLRLPISASNTASAIASRAIGSTSVRTIYRLPRQQVALQRVRSTPSNITTTDTSPKLS